MMDTSLHHSDFVNVNGVRLHYLDWGGQGPVILFLAGMGCSAHVYDQFAPRFTDNFHALALTRRGHGESDYPDTGYDLETLTEDVRQFLDSLKIDRVILVGHSMAQVELCHFAALYPGRVLKLVFLDAAYDRTNFKVLQEKNPLNQVQPPGATDDFYTIEEMIAHTQRIRPDLAAIWNEAWEEEFRLSITQAPDGKIVDKMSEDIVKALLGNLSGYSPETPNMQTPTLSIYAIWDNHSYWIPDYLTAEQQAAMIDFIENVQLPLQREWIEQFRRDAPHARIIEIPQGHHYCFIKHEVLVFDEMQKFLLEA